ncbi:glycosyltransferase [Paenibacillus swuensis]|uniref:glycosyltransferase n=1 Tax=Paenibacillus swuensis TaxID=1178515 RepID=UPI000838C298|nr:glycosyltransferase [Paenibacillus swuensis]
MKILIVLNYYYPYISGLSECARSLAEELAKDHDVTVLTAKHEENLSNTEHINGVKVVRADILFKISKGYISPAYLKLFAKLQKEADIVNLHLPMIESGILSMLTEKHKLYITYQCDIHLTKSTLNQLITKVMDKSSSVALNRANKVIISSSDYAENSRFLPKFAEKLIEIQPTSPTYEKLLNHHDNINKSKEKLRIGFCGRIVEEKGIDVLLRAAPKLKEVFPNLEIEIVGDYKSVAGGSVYTELKANIGWDESYVHFTGRLSDSEILNFYRSIDIFVLPSINSLEAFGMVQIEAMLAGVPVVATNLPGVREIVGNTKMGEIVEPKDVNDLTNKIITVLQNKNQYVKPTSYINSLYGVESAKNKYIQMFKDNNQFYSQEIN